MQTVLADFRSLQLTICFNNSAVVKIIYYLNFRQGKEEG